MTRAAIVAGMAGALAASSLANLSEALGRVAAARALPYARRGSVWVEHVLRPLRLAGAEGLLPTDRERIRLQVSAAVAGLALGLLIAGPIEAIALAAITGWLAWRALVWRRSRYRRGLEAGASTAALALADALTAGHSVRGAIGACASSLDGAVGRELRTVSRELEMGAETDAALERLRRRARSHRIDLVVAAVRVQRRSGGSLATLLRSIAGTVDEHEQLEAEARAASAQARFTSVLVVLLPVFGLVLGELASPGMVSRMTASSLGAWLLGGALLLQLAGVLLIRRLSRVDV